MVHKFKQGTESTLPFAEVRKYISSISATFESKPLPSFRPGDADEIAAKVCETILKRRFTHLSKRRAKDYVPQIYRNAKRCVDENEKIRFFFDIGPGYHASLDPANRGVSFNIELAEFFILYQVAAFNAEIREFYDPGVHFSLVVDNLCAAYVNGIPLSRTLEYCRKLGQLISKSLIADRVDVLAESEICSELEFQELVTSIPRRRAPIPTTQQKKNVSRFVGKICSATEVADRLERHRRGIIASDEILEPNISALRMTQRASNSTFGFRSFPGGDSRVQTGSIALRQIRPGKIRPLLLTSETIGNYVCHPLDPRNLTDLPIEQAYYAEKRDFVTD